MAIHGSEFMVFFVRYWRCLKSGALCDSSERRYANDTALNFDFFRIMEKIAVLILTCVKLLRWNTVKSVFLVFLFKKYQINIFKNKKNIF